MLDLLSIITENFHFGICSNNVEIGVRPQMHLVQLYLLRFLLISFELVEHLTFSWLNLVWRLYLLENVYFRDDKCRFLVVSVSLVRLLLVFLQ
jgi:hypothetical protein